MKNRENGIGAWCFCGDESDWVFAASREDAIAEYKNETGFDDVELAECVNDIIEVSDLDDATAHDYDDIVGHDEQGKPKYREITFRELIRQYEGIFPICLVSTCN